MYAAAIDHGDKAVSVGNDSKHIKMIGVSYSINWELK